MKLYISGIREHLSLAGIELITAERRARVERYVRLEDKARCLAAGLLLRRVCGVEDDSRLAYGENGKPCLKDGGVRFSISHSGDYAVLATSDCEVGVDIEKLAPYSASVAKRCFTAHELEWLRREDSDDAFFRLWTAKESVMKGAGLGFSLPPDSFCVLTEGPSAIRAANKNWFLDWLSYNGHMICCAVEGKAEKIELMTGFDHAYRKAYSRRKL